MKYQEIINALVQNGAQGIVLGCTEIPMLIRQDDVEVSVFDTTAIHATAAIKKH
ncbi:aspartate/glutamate racemase family protein [Methanomethylovorans sp.]|uniref:aspartate/glutamate racemase family protein n=1 Tax=Methanomethylovorans sp. TaxID=2758717 RepID=UPI00351C478F